MAVMKNGIKKINRKISNKVRNHQHCSLRTVVARDKKRTLICEKEQYNSIYKYGIFTYKTAQLFGSRS